MPKITDRNHRLGEIESLIQQDAGPVGICVGIASSSTNQLSFCAGNADIDGLPMRNTHLFGVGSITKVFVAVVVLQLVEEGKISLSDAVRDYLSPHVYRDIENAGDATIAQLLRHTTGIDSWEQEPSWIARGRGKDVNTTHRWEKAETLDFIRRPRKFASEPGTWYYSNTNYTLLGLIIETVTGHTAETEIRLRVLNVVEMKDTYVEGFEEPQPDRIPRRYHIANAAFRENAGICPSFLEVGSDLIDASCSNLSVSWMAGGIISSTSDLLLFACALRDGKLLNENSMKLMQEWQPSRKNEEMGLGLFRMDAGEQGVWLGHSGGVLGFSAGLWWEQGGDCVVCLLENVGSVHTNGAVIGVTRLLKNSRFLTLASRLINMVESR